MEALHPENESNTNQSAMSRLTSQLRNMARSSPTSPSISSSSEDSDDLTDDEEEGAVVNSSNVVRCILWSSRIVIHWLILSCSVIIREWKVTLYCLEMRDILA